MKIFYEAPQAEVIRYCTVEDLAVVPEANEDIGPKPEGSVGSKDF